MIWWLVTVVALTLAWGVTLLHRHLLTAQINSLRRPLDQQMAQDSFRVVSVQVIDGHVAQLASAVNTTLARLAARSSDERHLEQEFRQMTADLSHDLRTPLTAARGYAQALRSEPLMPSQ